jgi:hypothetical protein
LTSHSHLSWTCHSQVRATRAIAATDEILITYGQHDAAELLRTYGISEGEHAQPAVTLDFRIDEVVDATRTSLAKAGAVLSTATATARCEMLRGAGRLPACFRVRSVNGTLVPTEPTSMPVLTTAPLLPGQVRWCPLSRRASWRTNRRRLYLSRC